MSRDYKTRKPTKSTPEKGGSAFFGGFVGYALGLASAIGIWLYLNYIPSPFLPADKVAGSSEKNQTQPAVETPKAAEKPATPEPLAVVEEKPRFDFYKILPGIEEPEIDQDFKRAAEPPAQPKIAAKTPENNKPAEIVPQPVPPRLTVTLPVTPPPPQQMAAVPQRALPAEQPKQPPQPQQQPPVTPQTKAPAAAKEKIFLQAGSFRKNDEAENMKARLAMLGVFASVQPIDLAEKGTWYRVRIGPFNSKTDSDQTSASLRENGIETQFVKLQ
ncbi:SPOR domain-containing protein [Nitrosomonas sp. Is24]|uniref:SPOR domain-containing protein n=1 Tax=Nitrosomonas sp. Is24 TaxID=3080533 RepID=UPI00294B994F|nr:SPOR domain-containing protein [Nitrosomonas sp. Is24]MDV6341862.1 SPOR domain-containing protein [Nitrosomonas sp. Is24]